MADRLSNSDPPQRRQRMPDSPRSAVETQEICMDAGTITDVFRAVAATVDVRTPGNQVDAQAVHAALVKREGEGSTAIGSGSAIPHARVEGLNESILLDVKLRTPVRWAEGEEVQRCMVILVPPDAHEEHLELTARAVRKLSE
jgi:mannitol/fructose-specific phosphotransferase system IIA component (Ntr-type)